MIGTLVPSSPLDPIIRTGLDVLVVNAAEAAEILQRDLPATTLQEARMTAEALTAWGPQAVVVTLGAAGAAHADRTGSGEVSAASTAVVDTTGAGDALLGKLAVELARGLGLGQAVSAGVLAGSAAVTRLGAVDGGSSTRRRAPVAAAAAPGTTVAAMSPANIDAVESLIRKGEPYVRPRSTSDYWLYSTMFSSTCPVAFVAGAVVGVIIACAARTSPLTCTSRTS